MRIAVWATMATLTACVAPTHAYGLGGAERMARLRTRVTINPEKANNLSTLVKEIESSVQDLLTTFKVYIPTTAKTFDLSVAEKGLHRMAFAIGNTVDALRSSSPATVGNTDDLTNSLQTIATDAQQIIRGLGQIKDVFVQTKTIKVITTFMDGAGLGFNSLYQAMKKILSTEQIKKIANPLLSLICMISSAVEVLEPTTERMADPVFATSKTTFATGENFLDTAQDMTGAREMCATSLH